MSLKERIKDAAYRLGADLVGFGGIDRCANAPLMMSPQGLYPGAKTVVVMGIHHPDACVELGGERHPQDIGPYSVQYLMNSRLDEMAYRLATFIEREGYGAMPIASSNIWRYNAYKDLKAVFAPDVSHIYMAVVAGLADLGYSGLAITPEYGARNRFITVITDACIEADPLIPPGTVCDRCMLCRKHCPSKALSEEIDGDKVVQIGDSAYRFPNKNLWRCAWGEHFDLDLDLEIPERVTEQVILDTVREHGVRSGEMGQCLKFCVPKPNRAFDLRYSKTPLRVHWASTDEARVSRGVTDRLLARVCAEGAERLIVTTADELRAMGMDPETVLPGAKSAVTLVLTLPPEADTPPARFAAEYLLDSLSYDLTREIETLGFRTIVSIDRAARPNRAATVDATNVVLAAHPDLEGRVLIANTILTRMALEPHSRGWERSSLQPNRVNATDEMTDALFELAKSCGADIVGAASSERLDDIAAQLAPVFSGEETLDATDRSIRFTPWDPEVTVRKRKVQTPKDHLPGARSVLVFGLRLHEEVLRWATKPPAEAVGPYSFETYVTNYVGWPIAVRLIKRLEEWGYRARLVTDVTGTDSVTANPRGPQPDLFSNRFAGLAAGLGYLTKGGRLATPQFGLRQRLIAIVTDAPLRPSDLHPSDPENEPCSQCDGRCIAACPSQAFTGRLVELKCEGQTYRFQHIDAKRCDWVKRYSLMGAGGFQFLGSPVDVAAGATITPASLGEALRQHDPIKKYRPVVAEPCVLQCPLAFRADA
jgi:epoxyqueuosine reductase QueG